jgi:glycosyltransferase involved in cell wall biosynthesis
MIAPNTPFGAYSGERTDFLRNKFGIPPSSRIVLLSGSLIREHLALEVIDSVRDWPEGFVLAVHGWAPIPEYRAAVLEAAARSPGRVHVSFDVLPVEQVDDLYSSADIGLAVYRPVNRNFVYIGAAAGKVFGFMRVGTPTIASDLPGMKEIVATGSGMVVRDVAEIPERLLQIVASFDDFSRAAQATFLRYEFSRHYARVIARLESSQRVST